MGKHKFKFDFWMSVKNTSEDSPRKTFQNLRKINSSLKRKNQALQDKNTSLTAEVKRLSDELEREKLNRSEQFFSSEEIGPLVDLFKNNKNELDKLKEIQVKN